MSPCYPVFFINLDKHVYRRAFMEAQFAHLGLPLTRIPAALGADPEVRRHATVAGFATLTYGEIGCFESHRSVWKRVIDKGMPGAFIVEDDVSVASDFGRWTFPAEILENCDIIKIDKSRRTCNYGSRAVQLSEKRCLRRYLGTEHCTGSYFLTNRGAQKLYQGSRNYFVPVDNFMFDQNSKMFWSCEIWKLDRAAAIQYRHNTPENERVFGMDNNSITFNKNHGDDRQPELDGWQQARWSIQRLLNLDFRHIRKARKAKHLADFAKMEPIETRSIEFFTASWDHVNVAESLLKQEQVAAAR